ncbi:MULTISPECIES: acyl-CoA dehydrogenase family protein [unclassified Janthinobacterium]|uniref:acyl-CoA dehydrogenase family protein n=1 Tax=unclassified Janthinobacterium TaxID=2610881 RepID=UPI00161F9994|nr:MULTISPECIES: acyl-CoA dehydrogenase family protein [unclassified Janthinobacterium]MBB5607611.1 alkylation response protein AidB-like acyl-CoA dehydrogenase [Janthinobacterium sp. S3T4]MBB5612633.1 alkylation response protein AidB-like acyl-CoA dehydrogenase [Janthinobacterium sp. S3M3]
MAQLKEWLHTHADQLDQSPALAENVLPALAGDELLRTGVPQEHGGAGGDVRDAIHAIAKVAEQSVTAAFVFWGQRCFIEFMLQSPNRALAERRLPDLLTGKQAGASGLSNAMKFLSGIEQLQITATRQDGGLLLDGGLAWVTNLRKAGFVAAAAVAPNDGAPPAIVAFDSSWAGVQRSEDLDLIALRGSNTASVKLAAVTVPAADIISDNATAWLPQVRPAFLGMQCGLSIGLARASLAQAASISAGSRNQLTPRISALQETLETAVTTLLAGVHDGRFQSQAPAMFRLRIQLAELLQQALMLELQAMGGRAYLNAEQQGFARRWRESSFIPIVTPSLTQLQAALQQFDSQQLSSQQAAQA